LAARSRRQYSLPLMALGVAVFATGGALDIAHHVLGGAGVLPASADQVIAHGLTLVGMLLIVAGLVTAVGSRTRRSGAARGAEADHR
jgi:hypothetical protein